MGGMYSIRDRSFQICFLPVCSLMRFYHVPLICVLAIALSACRPGEDRAEIHTDEKIDRASAVGLDFEALLEAVDKAIGPRFQAMQMMAMSSASYQYDGSFDAVVEVVEPIVIEAGFKVVADEGDTRMGEAEQSMQSQMGFEMETKEQRTYLHPNGDTLMLVKTKVSNDELDMTLLNVQLMNAGKMSQMGAGLRPR